MAVGRDGPPTARPPSTGRVTGVVNDQLLTYPDAGHLIRLGCWPTTVTQVGSIDLGGTAAGLAAAQADVTPRIIAFVSA